MRYAELAELYSTLEQTPKRLLKTKAIAEVLVKTPGSEMSTLLLFLEGRIFPISS